MMQKVRNLLQIMERRRMFISMAIIFLLTHSSSASKRMENFLMWRGDLHRYPSAALAQEEEVKFLIPRGGSEESEAHQKEEDTKTFRHGDEISLSISTGHGSEAEAKMTFSQRQPRIALLGPPPSSINRRQRPKPSRVILDLLSSSSQETPESRNLRLWFLERKQEFLEDVQETLKQGKKPPQPKRLLHILAPKIPALKRSPDISLRIVSADAQVDPGLAASLIATIAHVCELSPVRNDHHGGGNGDGQERQRSPAQEVLNERQFEQLVECLVCGVDVQKRTKEYLRMHHLDDSKKMIRSENGGEDLFLQELFSDNGDDDDAKQEKHNMHAVEEGLSVSDCCRAAWGLVVLGAHRQEIISDNIRMVDLLRALSLRSRELLLHRMQRLCQDEFLDTDDNANDGSTLEERLSKAAREIAEDAAAAMWTFGCVRALSGIRSTALFQTCCSIFCQDATDLRERAQAELNIHASSINIGSNDVVEKLARSEVAKDDESNSDIIPETGKEDHSDNEAETDSMTAPEEFLSTPARINDRTEGGVLVDWLSPNEVSDILWALATHGEREAAAQSKYEIELSDTATILCDISFDRILSWLRRDVETLLLAKESTLLSNHHNGDPFPETETDRHRHEMKPTRDSDEQDMEPIGDPDELSRDEVHEEAKNPSNKMDDEIIVDEGLAVPISFLRNNSPNPKTLPDPKSDSEAVDRETLLVATESEKAVDAASLLAAEAAEGGVPVDAARLLAVERGIAVDASTLLLAEQKSGVITDITEDQEVESDFSDMDDTAIQHDTADELDYSEDTEIGSDGARISHGTDEGNKYSKDQNERMLVDQSDYYSKVSEPSNRENSPPLNVHETIVNPKESELSKGHLDPIFGSSELCTIAWTVSELKDSIRIPVIKEVARNIFLRGPGCLAGRGGSALSNLAQALSKVVVEGGELDNAVFQSVLEWIAYEAYLTVETSTGEEREPVARLLHRFPPPVLSRLVFALAAARCSTNEVQANQAEAGLVATALDVGVEYQFLCGAEELACLAFAYLELLYPQLGKQERVVAELKLGRIIADIELALSTWEKGPPPPPPAGNEVKGAPRFISFFGKSWSRSARIDRFEENEELDKNDSYPALFTEKARLPQLKDFPVDPSTLSRLAWSSSGLSRGSTPTTSDTLARVALRLFTSRNGRLLHECQAYDLASIARAASSTSHSHQREIVSLFTRRLLGVLNASPSLLKTSPPIHSVALLFSLGRLGVKYDPTQDRDVSPHRRLILVSELPTYSREEYDNLPVTVLTHLLRAVGSLDILNHDADFVKDTLRAIKRRLLSSDVPDIVLAGLVEGLGDLVELSEQRSLIGPATTSQNTTGANKDTESSHVISEILQMCKNILKDLANTLLVDRLPTLSTGHVRRITHVYATLPLQADEFINVVEENIEKRKQQFLAESAMPSDPSVLYAQIAANANFVKKILSGSDIPEHKGFSALKDGIKSFFGKRRELDGTATSDDAITPNQDFSHIPEERMVEMDQALEYIAAWGDSLAARSQQRSEGDSDGDVSVLVEVGRCQELIAHYRRHDFELGRRQDRLDQERQRDISKRILSHRLIP